MTIERLEAGDLNAATAQQVADLINAANLVDAPHLGPVSGEYTRLRLRHGWEDRPRDHLLVARDSVGEIVGLAEIELPRWDNLHAAGVDLQTHPASRGGPATDELLAETVQIVEASGRNLLIGDGWWDSYLARFWEQNDFEVGSIAAQRRLLPASLDWARLDALLAQASAASSAYDVIDAPAPASAELMPQLVNLQEAMNDAPIDDLEIEDDAWSEDRLRDYERAMASRDIRLHRLVARRRSDGELGGHTVVAIERERPHLGFQEDTGVVAAHRGHRLGLRLKIEMLRRLAEREPQLGHIDTWNAESNSHMIAVNDAIGCFVVARGVEVQKRLATA